MVKLGVRRKIFILILFIVIGLLYIGISSGALNKMADKKDFRVVYMNADGLQLKSYSFQRRMINILDVGGEVDVWVPGGLGWYGANKIEKLLRQENQLSRAKDIVFHNFGFDANLVVFGNEREDWWKMANSWGWGNYLIYIIGGQESLMIKEENVLSNLSYANLIQSNIMSRDFADSQVVNEGVRISIFNLGGINGLASFIARNMEWMGLTVASVENLNKEMEVDTCMFVYSDKLESLATWQVLMSHFSECKREKSKVLGEYELELYLNDKYGGMLNYQSYKQ